MSTALDPRRRRRVLLRSSCLALALTVHGSVASAVAASAPLAQLAQDSGQSVSLTVQIAVIVAVMVLVAAWPFRRGRTPKVHVSDDDAPPDADRLEAPHARRKDGKDRRRAPTA